MGNSLSWRQTPPQLTAREILNRAIALYEARDFATFAFLLKTYPNQVLQTYDDFFMVGTHFPDGEAYMQVLLELDKERNDERMAKVHAQCLRELRALETNSAISVIRVLCTHYGPERFNSFVIEKHLTIASGYDPCFRANMHNILVSTMKRRDEEQSLGLLKLLLEGGVPTDARYKADEGQPALHFAASRGLWQCVALLLKHGSNPDLSHKGESSRKIIAETRPDLLLSLPCPGPLNYDAELTKSLFHALRIHDETNFVRLLDEAHSLVPPAPYRDDDGWCTLLQEAAAQGLSGAVRALLTCGNCAHATSSLKDPPILLAAERGHLEIVLLLILYRLDEFGGRLFGAADVDVTSDHGDTVLHLLARSVRQQSDAPTTLIRIVETLDKRGELDLHTCNAHGETAFKLLSDFGSQPLFQLMLKKGAFLGVNHRSVQDMATSDLQMAFDSSLTASPPSRGYKVFNMDFECFYLKMKEKNSNNAVVCPEMLTLYKISLEPKHMHLLMHPIVTSFLDLKWLRLYWIYFINLALYFMFVVLVTVHIFTVPNTLFIVRLLTAVFWAWLLIRESIQAIMAPKDYFSQIENWLHIFITKSTPALFLFDAPLVNVGLILAIYAELSLLLGRHPSIARYVAMFLKVYKVNLVLLAISTPFILSFAVSFSVLFQQEGNFSNPFSALFKTFIMATGELDLEDMDFSIYPVASQIVVLLFVISIETILMNLLHALAVHDTEELQRSAQLVVIKAKIQLYTRLEAACLGYPIDWYHGSWGSNQKQRSRLRVRISATLKSLIHISVLPFQQEPHYRVTVREDGKLLQTNDNTWNVIPGNYFTRPLVKMVTGVNTRDIFVSCNEYVMSTKENNIETLTENVQELQKELRELKEILSKFILRKNQHLDATSEESAV